jgi:beta-1,4-mannosyl-glycoprotein beta-1,4-N-acetylglucosaminyltransferase
MKLIDCCMFNGEEIVKMRLEYFYTFFDKFYFIESWYTFTGNRKPFLYCEKYADWFAPYKDKIRFHILDELVSERPFVQEEHQRNSIVPRILLENYDSIVFFSDCDEFYDLTTLPSKEELFEILQEKPIIFFDMKLYYCRFTHLYETIRWPYAFAIHTLNLNDYRNIQKIRLEKIHNNKRFPFTILKNGWHFSFFMNVDTIFRKLESFSHQELNRSKYKNKDAILNAIEDGVDIFQRNLKISVLPFDHPRHNFPVLFRKYHKELVLVDLPKDLVSDKPA